MRLPNDTDEGHVIAIRRVYTEHVVPHMLASFLAAPGAPLPVGDEPALVEEGSDDTLSDHDPDLGDLGDI